VLSAAVEVVQVVVEPIVVIDVTVERITVKVLKKMRPSFSSFLGASAALMTATQAKRRTQAILKLILYLNCLNWYLILGAKRWLLISFAELRTTIYTQR
jgi:hypothetical protein